MQTNHIKKDFAILMPPSASGGIRGCFGVAHKLPGNNRADNPTPAGYKRITHLQSDTNYINMLCLRLLRQARLVPGAMVCGARQSGSSANTKMTSSRNLSARMEHNKSPVGRHQRLTRTIEGVDDGVSPALLQ
jgi:hypothetical protein